MEMRIRTGAEMNVIVKKASEIYEQIKDDKDLFEIIMFINLEAEIKKELDIIPTYTLFKITCMEALKKDKEK